MKFIRQKSIVFAVLACAVLGCSMANQIKKEVEKTQSPQTLNSTDNKFQLTVPGGWKTETELSPEAALQASNRFGELYVMVLRESKKDFGKKADLDFLTNIVRSTFSTSVSEAVLTEPVSTTIGAFPAKQFETSGEIQNIKLKYIYGVVETPENYYQIITWTLASRFDANKETLLGVINSFKELDASDATAPPPPIPANKKQ